MSFGRLASTMAMRTMEMGSTFHTQGVHEGTAREHMKGRELVIYSPSKFDGTTTSQVGSVSVILWLLCFLLVACTLTPALCPLRSLSASTSERYVLLSLAAGSCRLCRACLIPCTDGVCTWDTCQLETVHSALQATQCVNAQANRLTKHALYL